jgi:hypothetical protein
MFFKVIVHPGRCESLRGTTTEWSGNFEEDVLLCIADAAAAAAMGRTRASSSPFSSISLSLPSALPDDDTAFPIVTDDGVRKGVQKVRIFEFFFLDFSLSCD